MKRAVALSFLLVLAFPLASWSQTAAWTTFSPPGLNFSAQFPVAPTAQPPSYDKAPDGSIRSTTYLFMSSDAGFTCGIAVSLYSFTSDVEAELTADENNFLKGANATLLTSQRGVFTQGTEKLQELTFTFDMPQAGYRGKSNVVVAFDGNTMHTYMTMAMLPRTATDTSAIDKFLNSFVFTSTP